MKPLWTYGTAYTTRGERNRKNIPARRKKSGGDPGIYNSHAARKPVLEIAGTGHRFFREDRDALKAEVGKILEEYSKAYRVTVRTCLAYGADQLIAECAAEAGLTLKAVLPMPAEAYLESVRRDALSHGMPYTEEDERRLRNLLAQTAACNIVEDPALIYAGASTYLVNKCDKLIAIWDGKELPLADGDGRPINRGGTFDCIRMAKAQQKEVIIVGCTR